MAGAESTKASQALGATSLYVVDDWQVHWRSFASFCNANGARMKRADPVWFCAESTFSQALLMKMFVASGTRQKITTFSWAGKAFRRFGIGQLATHYLMFVFELCSWPKSYLLPFTAMICVFTCPTIKFKWTEKQSLLPITMSTQLDPRGSRLWTHLSIILNGDSGGNFGERTCATCSSVCALDLQFESHARTNINIVCSWNTENEFGSAFRIRSDQFYHQRILKVWVNRLKL
jgi:hypothetical protein